MPAVKQPIIAFRDGRASVFGTRPYAGTQVAGNVALYSWGTLQFEVHPLNIHEADHVTASDWAKKEIAGAAIYREWVGENDESIQMRGRIFPYRIGGLSELEAFEVMRRQGIAGNLIRGDGYALGWFVCEHLVRSHTFLSYQGVGQRIEFEAIFTRVPVPNGEDEFPVLWRNVLGG